MSQSIPFVDLITPHIELEEELMVVVRNPCERPALSAARCSRSSSGTSPCSARPGTVRGSAVARTP